MYKRQGLYDQKFKVSISETSSFLFTDLIRLGRSSHGESIESGVFKSKLEIMRNNDLYDDWEYVDQIEFLKQVLRPSQAWIICPFLDP